jgi:hypothetical protein
MPKAVFANKLANTREPYGQRLLSNKALGFVGWNCQNQLKVLTITECVFERREIILGSSRQLTSGVGDWNCGEVEDRAAAARPSHAVQVER